MSDTAEIGNRLSGLWRNKQTDTLWQFSAFKQDETWHQFQIYESTAKTFNYQLSIHSENKQLILRTKEDGDYLILKLTDKELWLIKKHVAYSFQKEITRRF